MALMINILWIALLFYISNSVFMYLYDRLDRLYVPHETKNVEDLNEEIQELNEQVEDIHNLQSLVLGGEFDEPDESTQ